MTLAAGVIGMLLSAAITSAIGTLPFLGPAYEDDSASGHPPHALVRHHDALHGILVVVG